jgi:hypothetical protein
LPYCVYSTIYIQQRSQWYNWHRCKVRNLNKYCITDYFCYHGVHIIHTCPMYNYWLFYHIQSPYCFTVIHITICVCYSIDEDNVCLLAYYQHKFIINIKFNLFIISHDSKPEEILTWFFSKPFVVNDYLFQSTQ